MGWAFTVHIFCVMYQFFQFAVRQGMEVFHALTDCNTNLIESYMKSSRRFLDMKTSIIVVCKCPSIAEYVSE